jgi:hypothetical protein
MKNNIEQKPENAQEEEFVTSSDKRGAWIIIGLMAGMIVLLVAVEVIRKLG